jgi:hypothetical protein
MLDHRGFRRTNIKAKTFAYKVLRLDKLRQVIIRIKQSPATNPRPFHLLTNYRLYKSRPRNYHYALISNSPWRELGARQVSPEASDTSPTCPAFKQWPILRSNCELIAIDKDKAAGSLSTSA